MPADTPSTDAYLGDGLYASFDGHQVELYASNGIERTNRVFLDDQTLAAFLKYVAQLHNGQHSGGPEC